MNKALEEIDAKAFADALFKSVYDYVAPAFKELESRIEALSSENKSLKDWRDNFVVPRDGRDGQDGKDADPAQAAQIIEHMLPSLVCKTVENVLPAELERRIDHVTPLIAAKAALLVPPGRDGLPGLPGAPGANGTDGQDGFSPDDLELSVKEGRTVVIAMKSGNRTVSRSLVLDGFPIYKGVYSAGSSYKKDDCITYGGSIWRALRATNQPPKGPSDNWQLIVKGGK